MRGRSCAREFATLAPVRAEQVAVIHLFALGCLIETGGDNTDRSNPAS